MQTAATGYYIPKNVKYGVCTQLAAANRGRRYNECPNDALWHSGKHGKTVEWPRNRPSSLESAKAFTLSLQMRCSI